MNKSAKIKSTNIELKENNLIEAIKQDKII
ncbi:MAG: hypothetical protein ACI8UC_000830 [Psychromonas sp.]|jgi:hypothetical protein